ncbi:MAG: hypothetical protein DRJ42_25175 [Deltaproteobacteria bacterium]|nr:MAG: hypothetical protein DRJ42_25175 [Deltaproteobacteria bacterium]
MSTPRVSIERIALVILPIMLAVIFIAVLATETAEVRYDLLLSNPEQVAPGAVTPLRALFFVPGEAISHPELRAAEVAYTVRDEAGAEVLTGVLVPAAAGATADLQGLPDGRAGMEGELRAPTAPGRYTLEAEVSQGGEVVARCGAPLVVTNEPRPVPPRGRPMMPMQAWEPRRLVPVPDEVPPEFLELRVRGGYCVPETDCELLVWVGEPAAAVHVEGGGFDASPPRPSTETSGIVRVRARITGPEAVATIVASRDGVVVARREVQLPIVLSGVEVGATPTLCAAPCTPEYESPEALPLFVDAYREGVWSRASSIAGREAGAGSLPLSLDEGLWRVQIRSDPFGSESAATRFIYVGDPGDADEALRVVRARLVSEGSHDAFMHAMPLADVAPEDQLAFAAALLEMDVIPLPRGRSSRLQQELGFGQERTNSRWLGALAVFAVGLFVGGFVLRRGLTASAEARAVMLEAEAPGANSRKRVLSMTLTVLGVVLVTILAFAAAALLMLTRGV